MTTVTTVKDIITTMSRSNLIDLHCHILPGIDDGSKGLEESLRLAQEAIDDGVRYIVATPHHLDRHYINHAGDVQEAVDTFQAELDQRGLELTIFAGQEIHLNGNLDEILPDLLGLDATGKYLLVELPHEDVPDYTENLFFRLKLLGITPVIAHPERNARIQANSELLQGFINNGAMAQVTATSVVGGFGRKVKKFSRELLEAGLVHILASDAHALKGRKFVLREAFEEVAKWDSELAVQLEQNAKQIVNGENI